MKLVDIILFNESDASEEAKRLGLERKPGFGNYGPVGKDIVTYLSRGGRLIPVADKNKSPSTYEPTTPSSQTPSSPTEEPTPKPKSSLLGRFFVSRKPNVTTETTANLTADLSKSLLQETEPTVVVETTVSHFGRTGKALKINPSTDSTERRYILEQFKKNKRLIGSYVESIDALFTSKNIGNNIPPISKWNESDLHVVHTLIHESIHAASPRLATFRGKRLLKDPYSIFRSAEEGVTEILAARTVDKLISDNNLPLKSTNYYDGYKYAISLIEKYTKITPEQLFNIGNPNDFVKVVTKALQKTRNEILKKIFSEEELKDIFTGETSDGSVNKRMELYALMMVTSELQDIIRKIEHKENISPQEKESLKRQFKKELQKIFKVINQIA